MDSLTGRHPGRSLGGDGLLKDDDRGRLVDDTAKAPLFQTGRMQFPVSSDGGEPLIDQPDAHPRRQEASQVSGPVAGVPGRARAATAHALGQTDDHLEGTVLLDEVNGLVEISTITVPPESYHRNGQNRVLIATRDTNTRLPDVEGESYSGAQSPGIRMSR